MCCTVPTKMENSIFVFRHQTPQRFRCSSFLRTVVFRSADLMHVSAFQNERTVSKLWTPSRAGQAGCFGGWRHSATTNPTHKDSCDARRPSSTTREVTVLWYTLFGGCWPPLVATMWGTFLSSTKIARSGGQIMFFRGRNLCGRLENLTL